MGGSSSCSSPCCREASTNRQQIFVSHCKRTDASEDRAIWVADTLDSVGFKAWFDRSDLQEITVGALREAVEASQVMITILDPFTFESNWVVQENEWARDKAIPILVLYDGDRFQWEQVAKWQSKYPFCFTYPALQYAKNYRKESREKLIAAVFERVQSAPSPAFAEKGPDEDNREVGRSESSQGPPNLHQRTGSKQKLSVNVDTQIRVAVGSSTHKDLRQAVEAAADRLISKLDAQPSFIIVAVSSPVSLGRLVPLLNTPISEEAVRTTLEKKFPGIPFVGTTSGNGIVVDCNWLSSGRPVVGLWGIYDPAGVYVVTHEEYPSQVQVQFSLSRGYTFESADVVAANEQCVYEAGCQIARKGMEEAQKKSPEQEAVIESPQFVLIFPSPCYEHAAVKGIGSVLGEKVPVLGGTSSLDLATFKSLQFSHHKSTVTGVCAALCWPSVHAIAAFCSGYSPTPNFEGTITKLDHCYRILEIDGKPARDTLLEWSGLQKKWDALTANLDFELLKETMLIGGIGVEVGRNEDLEPIYRVVNCGYWPDKDNAVSTGQAVVEGQRIVNMRSNIENLQDRPAKVTRQLLRNSGFSITDIRGAIAIMCGSVTLMGNDVVEHCGEQLSAAIGNLPLLGFCSGGEQGQFGDGTSSSGGCMCSTLAFTNKKVDNVMTPGKVRRSLLNSKSMLMTNQGTIVSSLGDDDG